MKRKQIHFTDTQLRQLTKLSKETGLSVAELVRRAVDEFLKKQDNTG